MPIPEIFMSEEEMRELLRGKSPASIMSALEAINLTIRQRLASIGVPVVEVHQADVPAYGWFESDPQTGKGLQVAINLAHLPKSTITPSGEVVSLPGLIGAILTHEMFHARRGHALMRLRARELYAGTPFEAYADKAAEFAAELAVRTGYPVMHAAFGLLMKELGEGLQPMYSYPAIAEQLGLPQEAKVTPDFEYSVFASLMRNPEEMPQEFAQATGHSSGQGIQGAGEGASRGQSTGERQQGSQGTGGQTGQQQGQGAREQSGGRAGQGAGSLPRGQEGTGGGGTRGEEASGEQEGETAGGQAGQTSQQGQTGAGGIMSEDVAKRIQAIGEYIESVLQSDEEIRGLLRELTGDVPQEESFTRRRTGRRAGRERGSLMTPPQEAIYEEPWRVELWNALRASAQRKHREASKQIGWKPRSSGALILPGEESEEASGLPIIQGRPHIPLSPQGRSLVPAAPEHILSFNPFAKMPLIVTLDTSGSMWGDINKALATIASFALQQRIPLVVNAGGTVGAVVAFSGRQVPTAENIRSHLSAAGAEWGGGTDLLAVIAPLTRYIRAKQVRPVGYVLISDTQSTTPLPPETLQYLQVQPQDAIILSPSRYVQDWAEEWEKQGARLIFAQ